MNNKIIIVITLSLVFVALLSGSSHESFALSSSTQTPSNLNQSYFGQTVTFSTPLNKTTIHLSFPINTHSAGNYASMKSTSNLLPLTAKSDDLTGTWVGTADAILSLTDGSGTNCRVVYPITLKLDQSDADVTGTIQNTATKGVSSDPNILYCASDGSTNNISGTVTGPGIVTGIFPDIATFSGGTMTSTFTNEESGYKFTITFKVSKSTSPVGKISEIVNDVTIIRADGSHATAFVGALVFPGDVIETSKTGAVVIRFEDNTTFAISESSRITVDEFIYDASNHKGSTFFSILQGIFVYTSGLIGKEDPDNKIIVIPVGVIGIRGTEFISSYDPITKIETIHLIDGKLAITPKDLLLTIEFTAPITIEFDSSGILNTSLLSQENYDRLKAEIFSQLSSPVGGSGIPIDSTALLLAGVQRSALWMIPAIVVAGAGISLVSYKKSKKKQV